MNDTFRWIKSLAMRNRDIDVWLDFGQKYDLELIATELDYLLKNFAQLIHFRLSRKQWFACMQLGKNAGTAPYVDSCTVLVLQQHFRCTVI